MATIFAHLEEPPPAPSDHRQGLPPELDAVLARALQDYVKETIAPFKYPRAIEFVSSLPRTESGKLQRFELRRVAAQNGDRKLAS